MTKQVLSMMAVALWAAAAGVRAEEGQGLEACVAAALEGNPDVLAMRARTESARAMVKEAQSAWYPQLGVAGTWARTDNAPQAFMMSLNQRALDMADPSVDFNNPEDTENLRLGLQARMLLFDGGRRGAQSEAARAQAEASSASQSVVRNELVHQVRAGWYGVRQAGAFLQVARESLASIEESLRVAREREQAGSALRTDVLNLEVAHAAAEEELIRAENRVELAIAALNTAIGRELATAKGVLDVTLPAEQTPAAVAADAVEGRAELAAARAGVRARAAQEEAAKGAYAPRFSAFGEYGWDADPGDDFEESYMAGVMAEWDVFTGFRRGASRQAAAAALRAARAEEASLRNRLALEFRQAELFASEAGRRLAVSVRIRETAEEALRITRARYQEGSADVTELLTAQTALTAARAREEGARYDRLIALSNMERAAGLLGRAQETGEGT